MKKRPEFFFLREKPSMALIAIRDLDPAYASMVAKTIDSTVPHTLKILAEMEEQGLISSRPEGRIRRLDLTEHGQRAATALSDLIDALGLESRGPLWSKLARLEELVGEANDLPGTEAELRLGPLRRDLARLKEAEDGDEELRRAADALDESVRIAIGGGG
jgi:DNA-binding MarR family transcriptional regulator